VEERFERDDAERTLELREERLVARREPHQIGEIIVRKEVDEVPAQVEVEALRQEVEIERVPIGREVSERTSPREEDGTLVVPIYEEKLMVVKRLVLKEELRIRRREVARKQRFEERVRKERVVVEDPDKTGAVHEHYASGKAR
jgi:uncharacterized protein (TIGR02271 family)